MLIEEMSVEACREVLTRIGIGRLACARNNQPYVVPIYFAYEPDDLYGFSVVGQKIEWMRSNPLVCVEVDEVISHWQWKSLILTGRYEELPETSEYISKRLHAQALIEKRYLWWQIACTAKPSQAQQERCCCALLYCIHIDDMTGRSAVPDSVELRVPL